MRSLGAYIGSIGLYREYRPIGSLWANMGSKYNRGLYGE